MKTTPLTSQDIVELANEKERDMAKLVIFLSEEEKSKIKTLAEADYRPMSLYVRLLLINHLNRVAGDNDAAA